MASVFLIHLLSPNPQFTFEILSASRMLGVIVANRAMTIKAKRNSIVIVIRLWVEVCHFDGNATLLAAEATVARAPK